MRKNDRRLFMVCTAFKYFSESSKKVDSEEAIAKLFDPHPSRTSGCGNSVEFHEICAGAEVLEAPAVSFAIASENNSFRQETATNMGSIVKNKWLLFILVSVLGFAADAYCKHLAISHLPYARPVPVIGQFVQFLLIYNKAALFGFDPRHYFPGFPLNIFFAVFSTVAIIALTLYYKMINTSDLLMRWGITLVMPGAMGNLFDRIVRPATGVVDFVRLGISETIYWPIFNLADVYLTFGIACILLSFIRDEYRRSAAKRGGDLQKAHANSAPSDIAS
jgi:signal peptidase II